MTKILFILSWFLAGGLCFYALLTGRENASLTSEVTELRSYRLRYEEQRELNARQREQFEAELQQLQNNLLGAQAQMRNLSEALQETRELIDPLASPPAAAGATDLDQSPTVP
jgi:hypothetical protein